MDKTQIQDAIDLQVKGSKVMDAGDGIFLARELEHIRQTPYNKKYAGIEFRNFFPVSHDAGEGANAITVRTYDHTGLSKIIDGYGTDLPRADVRGTEFTINVKQFGIAYGYSTDEIRSSQMVGKGLDAKRATAAMEGNERTFDELAWYGNSQAGIYGISTFPGIPKAAVAAGVSTDTEWSTKTPEEILFDMNNAVSVMADTTKMVEVPDTLLLPVAQYNYIRQRARTTTSDKTILKYFEDANPSITVEPANHMKGIGTSGVDSMLLYRKDPDAFVFEEPMLFKQYAPQLKGLDWEIPCEAKAGGINVFYPLSMKFWEGI